MDGKNAFILWRFRHAFFFSFFFFLIGIGIKRIGKKEKPRAQQTLPLSPSLFFFLFVCLESRMLTLLAG